MRPEVVAHFRLALKHEEIANHHHDTWHLDPIARKYRRIAANKRRQKHLSKAQRHFHRARVLEAREHVR